MNTTWRFAFARRCAVLARRWRSAREESGQTIIEFSLTALVLFTLLFGIMAFCLVMFSDLMTSEAAREGARYAMVRGNSWGTDCTAPGPANCIAQQGDIQTFAQKLVTVKVVVTATWLTSSGGACGTDDSCKSPGNYVKVTATCSYSEVFPLVPTQTYTMSSSAEMIVIQ